MFENEPIDGLDILAIEPRLIAQTLLSRQDEAGAMVITREVLARMREDFDAITDDELADSVPSDHVSERGRNDIDVVPAPTGSPIGV